MKLSVIIVSYNVKYYLDQCLRSVLRALSGVLSDEAEVIVVDNHSLDGSIAYLQQRYPESEYPMVRFVSFAQNLGFARANNIAIRQSRGEYVLLLNPDTVVGEKVLTACLDFLDAHPKAGAAGVRMLGANGRWALESRRGLPTPFVSFFKMLGFCNRWPQHPLFGRYYMGFLPWDEPGRIDVVSGAFCMLRRKALDDVGLLDEDFFMYGEDIDLSYRLLKGGYDNYFLPLDILHYKGESTQKSSFRYVHVFYEAMLIFFSKHYAGMSFLLSFPIKVAIYGRAMMALLGMLNTRVRKSLGFISPGGSTPVHYIFVGGIGMLDDCRALAFKFGLDAEFHGVADKLVWDEKKENCLVLDADTYDYEQMLEMIRQYHGRGIKLGTYAHSIGRVITEQQII